LSERFNWRLDQAVNINNRGQIVGNGLFKSNFRAFLLTSNP